MTQPDRLDLLETFLRVAETGALSRAAVAQGLSQPSVSRRIKALETITGVKLIHRTTHFLQLTEEGRMLLPVAREMLEKWDEAIDALRDKEPQGRLTIAAPVGLGQSWLIDEAAAFLKRYPAVRIDWKLTDDPIDIIAGEADIWIRIGATSDDRLVVKSLGRVKRILVATPQLANSTKDWTTLPAVALSSFYDREIALFDAKGRERLIDLNVVLASDNIAAVARAVRAGLGMALLPQWLIQEDLKTGALVRVAPTLSGLSLDLVLAYAPERGRPMRLTRFVEEFTQSARSRTVKNTRRKTKAN